LYEKAAKRCKRLTKGSDVAKKRLEAGDEMIYTWDGIDDGHSGSEPG